MNFVEFSRDVHKNAVAHGWWDEDRADGEIFALFHAELSEALEEHRAGRSAVWEGEGGKPEGWAVELVDFLIRIMDYAAEKRVEVDLFREDKFLVEYMKNMKPSSFPEEINLLHVRTAEAYGNRLTPRRFPYSLKLMFMTAVHVMDGIDWEALMVQKHEYNKTRPYKHGKKY